jgi:1-phosphofructokinase
MTERIEVVTVTPNPAIDWTLTIPGFAAGDRNRVEAQECRPAGKGVNVAASLAGAGHRVAVTGWLGQANAGAFETFFGERNIEDRFVRLTGETRVDVKVVDPLAGRTTEIDFPGLAPCAAERAALMERVLELTRTMPWVVLAGSLPPGVDPGFYCELATLVTAAGARVALDTSGEPLRRALKAQPQILKPNLLELETLVGSRLGTREAILAVARGLLNGETELIVVSMGANGALFVTSEASVVASPPVVAVRTTVGAGDALMAGIVAGRLRRLELGQLARLASAFALEAVTGVPAARWSDAITVQPAG